MSSRHIPSPFWRALALAACATLASGTAMAQWLWIDSAGNKVFSDTAPPPGTPDKNILRKPGNRPEPKLNEPATAPATAGATGSTPAPAAAPKVSGKDEQLEAKKKLAEKQAEEAAQAKKKAEAEQYAKARADNCERAKRAKATLDAGTRLSTTNAKGEREILDDKARAAEAKRADDVVRSDCGPMPAPTSAAPASAQAKP
ncbi:DUF4124 domain-containing protein [Hydrogenophaga sp. RWCD_12]|uniref:DUF4124 domain-containing protein n=1 Tax=Hydrogenophaga sp. RWCD_12 TaxID=3391190 RepID=UPI00398532E8